MNFNYWDLGQQSAGTIVQVTLSGNSANVRLFDSANYNFFKAGRSNRYYGGHATHSPVRLQVPSSGRWYLVVDYGGLPGRGRAGVQILPGRLPEIRQRIAPPLDELAQSVASINHSEDVLISKDWDVFISHASEDEDEIVGPLAHELRQRGLRVWYDEFELRIGDSRRHKIDEGIARSAFGVVVLSNAFFDGSQVLLPLWHKITKAEVMARSPSLADKLARNTSDNTLEEIAVEISKVVFDATQAAA